MIQAKKRVYLFEEGNKDMRDLLGGKGANLAEMTRIGLPVPPGFTITTEACREYLATGRLPEGLMDEVKEKMKVLEEKTGRKFGDPKNPLLVSVRSGAKFSMPGMMDTVLNLGLNDETVRGLAELTGDERFAYDAYRRFLSIFSDVVLSNLFTRPDGEKPNLDRSRFEEILERKKEERGAKYDIELSAEDLKEICEEYKKLIESELGRPFPEDPWEQLRLAIEAVFRSWNNKRAVDYRNFYGIPHDLGTAVNIQTMVFGNMGEDSGTGVAFTRNVATGEKEIYGEYLVNAQGEDVVAGIRTPMKISELKKRDPEIYKQFERVCEILERHYRDVQDIEFTVERGKLYILQCRAGKRTAKAAVKIAVDMAKEGLISKEEAIARVEPQQITQLLVPRFDPQEKEKAIREGRLLARGVNASPGAASGIAVFDADKAEELGRAGKRVILVRPETTPDDVHGMLASKGILTQRGGMTSHAAVVARGLGLPCVVGCEEIKVDVERRLFEVNGKIVREFDEISIDGDTGEVFAGAIPTLEPKLEEERELSELLRWADEIRRLGVWANADYPRDARRAVEFGAEGIGLCRTEHMFMETDRLPWVQKMIMAQTPEERKEALDHLLPLQRGDFEGIFEVMEGRPVVIRLIDPPLHEFLPNYDELLAEIFELREKARESEEAGRELSEKEKILSVVRSLKEANPMMGLRGCRLGILYPEIIEMQTRAIIEAACEVKRRGKPVRVKIMIPLVSHVNELRWIRERLESVARKVMEEQGMEVDYSFGTMIETPRAALTASEIAKVADFFSFGTNDLTQMVFGFSRDDAEGKVIMPYTKMGILEKNPFQTLDVEGVGRLVEEATRAGKAANPNLEVGICGEHGGDPESIRFFHKAGLDYVSCSPFRVPAARLAAAQAALAAGVEDRTK